MPSIDKYFPEHGTLMITKKDIHFTVLNTLNDRIIQLNAALNDALDATANETKSTAGDKHETGRAMAQIEQEKLGSQLGEAHKLKEMLSRIDPEITCTVVGSGSLVESSLGTFYVSVGIGVVTVHGMSIFCMTPLAPLCNAMMNKKAGDSILWQGKEVIITGIS